VKLGETQDFASPEEALKAVQVAEPIEVEVDRQTKPGTPEEILEHSPIRRLGGIS